MTQLRRNLTMMALLWVAVVLVVGFVSAPAARAATADVQGDITRNTKWKKKNQYVLRGGVFVKSGVTLTIKPGTRIFGTTGSFLVVERGAKIIANGTARKPIVMTSSKDAGQRTPGDWGGILILGAAPVNRCPAGDCRPEGLPPNEFFGGTDPESNSGVLRYFRSEFAGFELSPGNELNSITFSGVGAGTQVDHIQASNGLDDAIEFFGGTVRVKYAVGNSMDDDGFDWQLGYLGYAQFVVIQQQREAHQPAERGIEADNSEFNVDATPRSSPLVANFTLIGDPDTTLAGAGGEGIELRRGTAGHLRNFIVMNFRKVAIRISDNEGSTATAGQYNNNFLDFQGFILFNNNGGTNLTGNTATLVAGKGMGAQKILEQVDPDLTNPSVRGTKPDFRPQAGSPALDPANAAPKFDPAFFDNAPYVGAFNGTDDWTEGWTSWIVD